MSDFSRLCDQLEGRIYRCLSLAGFRWENDSEYLKRMALVRRIERLTKVWYHEIPAEAVPSLSRRIAELALRQIWPLKKAPYTLRIQWVAAGRSKKGEREYAQDCVVNGFTSLCADKIYIASDIDPRRLPFTIAHELAHVVPRARIPPEMEEVEAEAFARRAVRVAYRPSDLFPWRGV